MRILGIDPGSRFTGWGLLEQERNRSTYLASGTLRLGEGKALSARLVALAQGIERIMDEYRPDQCALEQIFTARNARSALVLGHARGVILCGLARTGLPLFEYSPTQVKQAVSGAGRASKDQINKMVAMLLGRKETLQEDEADALAVALTHSAMVKWESVQ